MGERRGVWAGKEMGRSSEVLAERTGLGIVGQRRRRCLLPSLESSSSLLSFFPEKIGDRQRRRRGRGRRRRGERAAAEKKGGERRSGEGCQMTGRRKDRGRARATTTARARAPLKKKIRY